MDTSGDSQPQDSPPGLRILPRSAQQNFRTKYKLSDTPVEADLVVLRVVSEVGASSLLLPVFSCVCAAGIETLLETKGQTRDAWITLDAQMQRSCILGAADCMRYTTFMHDFLASLEEEPRRGLCTAFVQCEQTIRQARKHIRRWTIDAMDTDPLGGWVFEFMAADMQLCDACNDFGRAESVREQEELWERLGDRLSRIT
ncbi:hypothetical protein FB45DRAFT_1035518 [Roridomyces roridus]|uniref:Uncharacterized protein n=1 Tax=Roridomyces roridus TaxID=1738132 RepID=A0AAD7BB94_9AGAR|nr:hypothetical protein FB45DRAFT_1035518 [Roridomyces roridus]